MPSSISRLPSRGVIRVDGPQALPFLQGIVTTDLDDLAAGTALPGALLSPQGKIIADFLISRDGNGVLIDLDRDRLPVVLKRLQLYKLRSEVTFGDETEALPVFAILGDNRDDGGAIRDGRNPGLGGRAYGATLTPTATVADYDALRIRLGILEGGCDYPFDETVPHEAGLDATGGLSFKKGCYVGQEVVSRMQHRATARRRPVLVSAAGDLPAETHELTAGTLEVGRLGSRQGRNGLGIARLDRVAEARANGVPILAGSVPVELALPANAVWDWPPTDK